MSGGSGPASWSPRDSSAGFRDIGKFPFFLENWKRSFPPSRRLSNEGGRRKLADPRARLSRKVGHSRRQLIADLKSRLGR